MSNDPFAALDAEPQVEEITEPTTSVWEETPKEITSVTTTSDANKVRVTFKLGGGYEAPWITIDGTDIPDTVSQLQDHAEAFRRLAELTATYARGAQKTYQPQAQPAPAQQSAPPQQQAPGGETKQCKHGEMTFRSGFSKSTGKAYKGFFCAERDRDQQCKPEFIK